MPVEVRSLLMSRNAFDASQSPVTKAEQQLGVVQQRCVKQAGWMMVTACTDLHTMLPSAMHCMHMCMPDLCASDQAGSGGLTWLVWCGREPRGSAMKSPEVNRASNWLPSHTICSRSH